MCVHIIHTLPDWKPITELTDEDRQRIYEIMGWIIEQSSQMEPLE